MKKFLLMLFSCILLPFSGFAQDDSSGYVQVAIEFKSMFPGNLQIRDEVCKPPRDIECEKARIKVQGDSCRGKTSSTRCREARELLAGSFCIEGLIFDGRVVRGEKITLSLCTSSTGFGNVSIRNTSNGSIWTNYPLLVNGAVLVYP